MPPICCHTTFVPEKFNQMTKVYAVIGGWDYEGEDFKSLRLFDCFSTADAYLKELEAGDYDYSMMDVREVVMESALAVA
jgi:hypothetical protein